MRSWLVAIVIGFPLGALTAATPALFQRLLIRRRRWHLAKTGLRPGLRVRVTITPDADPHWAHLTVHLSNRTKDIWWLQQIDFPAGKVRGTLASDRLFARFEGDLSAVPIDALPESGSLFPSRSIHPNDSSTSHFTGVADGICEHAYLYCPGERDRIAVDVTLRRMGGTGRAITVKAVRAVSW
ncbi:hypothetical protein EWE75_14035 [Sphingomonas populi]|uniref:Uncharacterized protein n=1 Tax=Sphingomonas populi TaxID=2484750 RepID=A0A4Q6XTQ1_9SPHN|nr:hypothetical protein [Sphingomonas populi]RZF63903.1 hypothetical protein EWE75_14035 [Sphingomonas populi]